MMTMITAQVLRACGATDWQASRWEKPLQQSEPVAGITTPARAAAYLAVLMHESGELRHVREIWNPAQVPAQARYETRRDLGIIRPGDGQRYLGRGPIQVTGRANYASLRDRARALGIRCPDFEIFPEDLEQPQYGALAAALFWSREGCNLFADRRDIDAVSGIVNRGSPTKVAMHLPERRARYRRACAALGVA